MHNDRNVRLSIRRRLGLCNYIKPTKKPIKNLNKTSNKPNNKANSYNTDKPKKAKISVKPKKTYA